MKLFMRYFIIYVFIFSFFSHQLSANFKSNYQTISFENQSYQLTKPIITKHNIDYIPLVELKSLFQFKISFNHKLHGYHYKNNSFNLFFPLNSSEVWLNKTRHFFSAPSFIKHSCVYVPLDDIALLMGFFVQKDNQKLLFIKNKTYNFNSSSPLVIYDDIHVDSTRVTIPKKNKLSHILYKHNKISLKDNIIRKNNINYLNSKTFLSTLGYKVSQTETELRLAYNNITYIIPFSSRIWSIIIDKTQTNFLAEAPLLKSNKTTLLLPFTSLLGFLDYSIAHNHINASLELLDNIHSITLNGKSDPFSITILSRHSLLTDFDIDSRNGLLQEFTIPFSKTFTKSYISLPLNPFIKKINTRNLNYTFEQMHNNPSVQGKKQTLISIHLSQKTSFYPMSNSNGLFLSHNKVLETFSVKQTKDMYIISIKGHKLNSPLISKESKKLIFDFKNTVTLLSPLQRINSYDLRSIRTSQLSFSPLVSRFVIDFKQPIPTYTIENKKSGFIITFKKTSPPKTSIAKKTKRRPSYKNSIRNKVIVLDAGHGGRDPGAVIGKNFYEKKYTLDVVLRVKRLLEKEGAYVILTRNGDHTRSLSRRTYIANRNKGDLFVSIHFNTFSSPRANGSKSFYYKKKDKRLARSIQNQLKRDLSIKSSGIKRSRFFVLRHTRMPAVLIEPLFLSNPKEKKLLVSSKFRNLLATSIFNGIKNYYL
jgi:N-acetylmuramoyl-L-alanine amidase